MTQGFDEYININYNENLDDLTKILIHDAYKAGAASRQAEIDELKKILAMYEREGYKLVPVEPTQKMIDDAVNDTPETPSQDYWHDSQPITDDQDIACYKAMIGAVE